MAITFRVGKYIDPSGFGLAVVDIPPLDPEKNISLLDTSHKWEENVATLERSIIKSYVDGGGHFGRMTLSEFLVTNVATTSTNDMVEVPLFYRHQCRFYHFSYGDTPARQIHITDQDGNIIKNVNYVVKSTRIASGVFKIDVITDFHNNDATQYKVKYNRCLVDGTNIFPGWVETLNAVPLFTLGSPFVKTDEYSVWGPDSAGLYSAVVPPVPTLTPLVNSIGISFEQCPTIIDTDVTNNVTEYAPGLVIKYTLKATGPSTFTVHRNYNMYGSPVNEYLQSSTTATWGASPVNFTIGTLIRSIYGTSLNVHGDAYLATGDEAYFTAKRSTYYMIPTSYSSIYMKKPEHVVDTDNWYIRVRNGRFKRRMDANGQAVPSGYGETIVWEYGIPEYQYQMWNLTWGPPYKESFGERVELIDKQTVQLQRTPIFIDPSSVLHDPVHPGFPPSGYLSVYVNDVKVPATGIVDWDIYNGTVKLAQMLTHRDDVIADYAYEENYFEYTGCIDNTPGSAGDWMPLDANPTPAHNYGMYASGVVAHVFLKPYIKSEYKVGAVYGDPIVTCTDAIYHNFTGTPSGVFDFELGTVALGPHCRVTDLQVTDVRKRGGGLSDKGIAAIEEVKKVQPESEFFWDTGYFDGQAVPANGSLVVRIPKTVLKSNGGRFEEDEVKDKVMKHIALGNYPIIEYT